MKRLLVVLLLVLAPQLLFAKTYRNVLYISIDGLSQNTFYELLKKNRLPNIKQIVNRGNFRNMDLPGIRPDTMMSYYTLLSGYPYAGDTIPSDMSIFERLEEQIPNLTTVALVSEPIRDSDVPSLNSLLVNAASSIDILKPVRRRTSTRIGREAVRLLEPMRRDRPFLCS